MEKAAGNSHTGLRGACKGNSLEYNLKNTRLLGSYYLAESNKLLVIEF